MQAHASALIGAHGNVTAKRYAVERGAVSSSFTRIEHTMAPLYKPAGYTSVSPYLIVDGASKTIDFLTQVFDAKELQRFADSSGRLMHSEVRIDDTVVMIADSAPGWPPVPMHVHVYVPDVDATYRAALAAGATSVQEPVKKEDADKRGGFKDPIGTTWWVGTKME